MSTTRNVFTVTDVGCSKVSRVWRKDLDISCQMAVVHNDRKVASHAWVMKEYESTCASKGNHAAFLAALLGEARRFNHHNRLRTISDKQTPKLPAAALEAAHMHIQEEMSAHDVYPKLITEIAALRLFNAIN